MLKHEHNTKTLQDWPSISIIVVNLNGRKWLERCLRSVFDSDYSLDKLEVILVDNGSTDGSVELVRESLRQFRISIVQNKENIGWSPANNLGARLAKGEIIVCLSNDMLVDPRWLKEIVYIMKSNPRIGVVQCNSISMLDRKTIDSGMNFLDRYGFAYSYRPLSKSREVFFAEGMAFAIRPAVFRHIGGFDDYYFMEYDDMDLCWRARLAGYKVFLASSAIVYHARGGTVGSSYFTKRKRNITLYVRNHFVTLLKNYELKNLFGAIPVVFYVQMLKILYFVGRKHPKLALATIQGLFLVLKDSRRILKERQRVQTRIRKVPDREIVKLLHPFQPKLLYSFISSQAMEERLVLNSYPPVEGD